MRGLFRPLEEYAGPSILIVASNVLSSFRAARVVIIIIIIISLFWGRTSY
jgi:hypothetical protein